MSNMKEDDTKLFPYNSRIVRLKDEDRFQVCLDLRRRRETTTTTTETQTQTEEDELTQRVPRIRRDRTARGVRRTHHEFSGEVCGEALVGIRVQSYGEREGGNGKGEEEKRWSKPVLRETSSFELSDAFGDAEDVLSEEIDFDLEKR